MAEPQSPEVGRVVDRTVPGPAGDLPVRLYRRYADQLVADGVPTRHVEYEGMIHGFATMLSNPDLDRAHDAVADVAGDLREAFDGA